MNWIRITLLVSGALVGGYLVDKNMKSRIPIFTIGLPVAAVVLLRRINADFSGDDE